MRPVGSSWIAVALGLFLALSASTGDAPSRAAGGVWHDAGVAWLDCIHCEDEVGGKHTAPNQPGDYDRSGGSHSEPVDGACTAWMCVGWEQPCNPPDPCTCTDWMEPKHPECGISLALLMDVEEAYTAGDAEWLMRTLGASDAVVLNRDRSAVQVYGCDGELAGHFPMGAAFMATLVE